MKNNYYIHIFMKGIEKPYRVLHYTNKKRAFDDFKFYAERMIDFDHAVFYVGLKALYRISLVK